MMVDYIVQEHSLQIGANRIAFHYPIRDVTALSDRLIVVLEIPPDSIEPDNIYAVGQSCEILWQVQSRHLLEPGYEQPPYVGVSVWNGLLLAVDFMGKRYWIDAQNGAVIGRDRYGREW